MVVRCSQLNLGVRQQHATDRVKVLLALASVAAVQACADPGVRSRVEAPSSYLSCRSAPAPGATWRTVQLTLPAVTFQVPPGWSEKSWDVQIGDVESWHTFRTEADVFQNLTITEQRDSTPGRLPGIVRQSEYTDYVECVDSVGGRRALLQAWRGGGTIFRGSQQSPSFGAHLTLEVDQGRYATVSGSSADLAGQDEIVAILKTFRARPSPGK